MWKIASSYPPESYKSPWFGVMNFGMNRTFVKKITRVFRLSVGKAAMTLALFVLTQYHSVSDGWTDGQTDKHL